MEMGRCPPSGVSSASERQAAHSSRRFAGSVPDAKAPFMKLVNLVSSCSFSTREHCQRRVLKPEGPGAETLAAVRSAWAISSGVAW